MKKDLEVNKKLRINASVSEVWDAIVNSEKVKQYFFGTEVESDWKKGSPIIFKGEFQGNSFCDKGTILEIEPGKWLQYNYWSGFSGLEDKPENYSIITYELSKIGDATELALMQRGFASEEAQKHSEVAWGQVLEGMKQLVER